MFRVNSVLRGAGYSDAAEPAMGGHATRFGFSLNRLGAALNPWRARLDAWPRPRTLQRRCVARVSAGQHPSRPGLHHLKQCCGRVPANRPSLALAKPSWGTQRSRRASRSHSRSVRVSPSRTGPLTLRMMERLVSSMNSTRTWVTLPVLPVRPSTLRVRKQRRGAKEHQPWNCADETATARSRHSHLLVASKGAQSPERSGPTARGFNEASLPLTDTLPTKHACTVPKPTPLPHQHPNPGSPRPNVGAVIECAQAPLLVSRCRPWPGSLDHLGELHRDLLRAKQSKRTAMAQAGSFGPRSARRPALASARTQRRLRLQSLSGLPPPREQASSLSGPAATTNVPEPPTPGRAAGLRRPGRRPRGVGVRRKRQVQSSEADARASARPPAARPPAGAGLVRSPFCL